MLFTILAVVLSQARTTPSQVISPVTVIDVVSPANKLTPQGREAYLETRRRAKLRGANVVEIDLCLQGEPMLDYSREGLPEWDYAVTVTRASSPPQTAGSACCRANGRMNSSTKPKR